MSAVTYVAPVTYWSESSSGTRRAATTTSWPLSMASAVTARPARPVPPTTSTRDMRGHSLGVRSPDERPGARMGRRPWYPVGTGSVQQRRQPSPGLAHPGVVDTHDLEILQETRADDVLAGGVELREQREKAVEGVLHVAARDVEVGHAQLRVR